MNSEARIDKWLWAARIYKTRTLASDACKNGRITINGALAKPSRTVKVGDQVGVKKSPITYSFRVLQTIEKRVGAKLLPEVFETVTPPEQYELLEMNRIAASSIEPAEPDVLQKKTVEHSMTLRRRPFSSTRILTSTENTSFCPFSP